MSTETLVILMSVLSTPFLGILVAKFFERNKTDAETHNINIGGEISLSDGWQKYAVQQKEDKEELRKEFNLRIDDLQKQHSSEIVKLKDEFTKVTNAKDERIKVLENKVSELEKEVSKYKGVGTHIVDMVHTKVEEIKNEIIN